MNKRIPFLELIRGIACLFVVLCHYKLDTVYGTYIVAIARFAVPFFLILSGYYAYKPLKDENIAYAKKKLISVCNLTLIGTIICVCSNSLVCILQGNNPFKWVLDIINIETLILFILFNRAYWLSSVMYYLFMMIYVYVIYIIINKLSLTNFAYALVPVLLVLNVIVCKTFDVWYYAGNFLLTGFPFFMLGNFIRKNGKVKISKQMNIGLILLGIILTIVENYFNANCYCFVGTILISVSVFLFGINNKETKVPVLFATFGTKYSMLIFLLHCSIGKIIVQIGNIYNLSFGNLLPLIVIVVTIIISMAYVFICEKVRRIFASSKSFT